MARITRIGVVLLSLMILVVGTARAHDVPPGLEVPDGNVLLFEYIGDGVQIYECQARPDDASALQWTFRFPEATLLNEYGEVVGRHYAGPTWEGNEGSQVVAEARANVPSADPSSIPWLLLQARSNAGAGIFSSVTYIHRLETVGGQPPAGACAQAGQELRVPYLATYVFYGPAAPAM
jgi:hypothetical protein